MKKCWILWSTNTHATILRTEQWYIIWCICSCNSNERTVVTGKTQKQAGQWIMPVERVSSSEPNIYGHTNTFIFNWFQPALRTQSSSKDLFCMLKDCIPKSKTKKYMKQKKKLTFKTFFVSLAMKTSVSSMLKSKLFVNHMDQNPEVLWCGSIWNNAAEGSTSKYL